MKKILVVYRTHIFFLCGVCPNAIMTPQKKKENEKKELKRKFSAQAWRRKFSPADILRR